jgi:hypothetical protein
VCESECVCVFINIYVWDHVRTTLGLACALRPSYPGTYSTRTRSGHACMRHACPVSVVDVLHITAISRERVYPALLVTKATGTLDDTSTSSGGDGEIRRVA